MKSRKRMALVMFLLAVIFVSHAVSPQQASPTSCSSCACGYAVHLGSDFAAFNLK